MAEIIDEFKELQDKVEDLELKAEAHNLNFLSLEENYEEEFRSLKIEREDHEDRIRYLEKTLLSMHDHIIDMYKHIQKLQ